MHLSVPKLQHTALATMVTQAILSKAARHLSPEQGQNSAGNSPGLCCPYQRNFPVWSSCLGLLLVLSMRSLQMMILEDGQTYAWGQLVTFAK